MQILVIDDQQEVRSMISLALEGFGHAVLCAETGARGLELARQTWAQIMFVDHRPPDISGVRLARQLRGEHPSAYLVCLTDDNARPDCDETLFDAYLAKPFSLDELERVMRAATRS